MPVLNSRRLHSAQGSSPARDTAGGTSAETSRGDERQLDPGLPLPPNGGLLDNQVYNDEAAPFVTNPEGRDNPNNKDDVDGPLQGFWGWLEGRTRVRKPCLWLVFNSLVSFLWGAALATFASGVVAWSWTVSEFAKKYDSDWTNEAVALIGSICTVHVTYVLQLILKEYSYVMLAGEFTLKDLKCLQGVNEISAFAEFPDRPGAPPRAEGACGPIAWWGSVHRFCNTKRLAWYILYIGVALHTTSVVSILQPELRIQHVTYFNDSIPCPVHPNNLSFSTDQYLTDEQQFILDRFAYEIGLQLANYADQVGGNTTSAIAGRKYRKDNLAYGAVGGLIEGLQDIPGASFSANCTEAYDIANRTAIWNIAFPNGTPPNVSTTGFRETNAVPTRLQRVLSHPTPSFNFSLTESAMYAVVDHFGNGAFMTISEGQEVGMPVLLTCGWRTLPRTVTVQMVNFTSLALSHDPTDKYPSLIGRATLSTLQGMAQGVRLGASLNLAVLEYRRRDMFYGATAGYSYELLRNTTSAQIVETILADGGKASMTPYNVFLSLLSRRSDPTIEAEYCPSNNKTVSEHYQFGNKKQLGWISVIWTTGMGILGFVAALWMNRKKRVSEGMSPLGAAGGFTLARGETIDDYHPLVFRDGKVVDAEVNSEVV